MAPIAARDIFRRSPAARAGLFAAALVVVAEGAVFLLGPGDARPDPVAVRIGEYLPPDEVARAVDYRDGQRILLLVGLGAQALAVGALAVGWPRSARRLLERLGRRASGAAVAGASVVVLAQLVALPTGVWAHERAVDVGLSTQSLSAWLGDQGLELAIAAAIGAVGAGALSALIRRYPKGWWIGGSVVIVGYGAAMSLLAPVLIAPLFNDFEKLPETSELRQRVVELGARGDVEVGEVSRVDASRRSTALNAYVAGLGPTKRVVLYDTLIDGTEPAELDSVVAHELAHVAHSDIPRGILFAALVTPLGLLLVREIAYGLNRTARVTPGSAAAVPGLFLAIGLVSFGASVPANQLSRQVEASADAFALEVTGDPQALIDLQVRLASANLSDPDPPAVMRLLFGTHPTTAERIGAALAWDAKD